MLAVINPKRQRNKFKEEKFEKIYLSWK